ncbi:MAG: hypothetical protein IJ608_13630 [Lachnospiraceae bacterium]|nr:hypothetical protein [Lachnospiraceae bacterium]
MSIMQSDETLTITEIAKQSNLFRSGAQYIMDNLKGKGMIKRSGSKKNGKFTRTVRIGIAPTLRLQAIRWTRRHSLSWQS